MMGIGLEMIMVDRPKVYRDGFESDAIRGDKTVLEVSLNDLFELGFDTTEFGYGEESSSDTALDELLSLGGVGCTEQKKLGIRLDVPEDNSTAEEYAQFIKSLQINNNKRLAINGFVRTVVSDCWPFTTLQMDKKYNPLTMRIDDVGCLITTRQLEGRWDSKEQLTKAAAGVMIDRLILRDQSPQLTVSLKGME